MGRDTNLRQQCENMLGNAVIQYTLTADGAFFLRIEGGRVILEILDDGAGLRPFIEDLGFAFINLGATGHAGVPTHETCNRNNMPRRRESGRSAQAGGRSEEHTSELQFIMSITYAAFRVTKHTTNLRT